MTDIFDRILAEIRGKQADGGGGGGGASGTAAIPQPVLILRAQPAPISVRILGLFKHH